ncbi:MAG: hypothetical protein U1F43_02140 [Myxococcota bacterium]
MSHDARRGTTVEAVEGVVLVEAPSLGIEVTSRPGTRWRLRRRLEPGLVGRAR